MSYLHSLVDDPGFLQEILGYLGAHHRPSSGELHFQVLAEATGVVVDGRAGVSESLHQAVDQQDLLLEGLVVGLRVKTQRWQTSCSIDFTTGGGVQEYKYKYVF